MNPHADHPTSLVVLVRSLWRNRQLIVRMARREVVGRYQGSVMGLLWSLLNPLFMLAIYTFVFSVVFKARWGGPDESRGQFAIVLFAGLLVHGLFAEVLNRAPQLILSNVNYVKKVVFPLEILPVVQLVAASFHAGVSVLVLLGAQLLVNGHIPWTLVLLPLVIAPLLILTLALAWLLASLGVFVRDVGQTIALLTSVLLFMSPIFFPLHALPPAIQPWMQLNPLTFIIEQVRAVLVWGDQPNWGGLLLYGLAATGVTALGFAWFQKTRKGFADVL
jgi:lipopolysaccharide transport system permease protein